VVVDRIEQAGKELQNRLEAEGGYPLTHVVEVERADRGNISRSQTALLFQVLGYLFSFANGAWCTPVLTQGIDLNGSPIWTDMTTSILSRWREKRNLFDRDEFNVLGELGFAFSDLCF
jgi:hypothetical protein